jgi:hypothetical protein
VRPASGGATAVASRPPEQTYVRYAAPVTADGEQLPTISVSGTVNGRCQIGSDVVLSVSVYRCFSGNEIYDPCWAMSSGPSVLCLPAPWSASVVEVRSGVLNSRISIAPTDLDAPWAVQLTSGERCLGLQGAHDLYSGRAIDFACTSTSTSARLELLRGVNRLEPLWTYQTVVRQGSGYRLGPTVAVGTAWFAGPPPMSQVSMCRGPELRTSIGAGSAGLGHRGVAVVFLNSSSTTCELHGYPGVAALNSGGEQAAQAIRSPSGYLGGLLPGTTLPPTVILSPGQTASALVEGTDDPVDRATSCPSYPALLVTAPNTTEPVRLSIATVGNMPGCSPLYVHPVVPGDGGSQL